jgi:hypothetical protein
MGEETAHLQSSASELSSMSLRSDFKDFESADFDLNHYFGNLSLFLNRSKDDFINELKVYVARNKNANKKKLDTLREKGVEMILTNFNLKKERFAIK